MARRKATDTASEKVEDQATGPDNADMDFNDPETGNHHEAGGEVQDPDAEAEQHAMPHEDDGTEHGDALDANRVATENVLGTHDGAEPEKVYDTEAAAQDTDNTHEDGNNGLHQEDYVDGDTAAELGRMEAEHYSQHGAADDTGLAPGDVGRRLNLSNAGVVHSTLAPANRDETIVGDHPETEKGLRPLAPLDGATRTDDAGRPFDGDSLHTAEKGRPVGQGVIEHVHAPTATGAAPEGVMSARAPVPVASHQRDPARIERRGDLNTADFPLSDTHHTLLDHAEDMAAKGAHTFTAAQIGAKGTTADELVSAGLLTSHPAMAGSHFPDSGNIYRLNY